MLLMLGLVWYWLREWVCDDCHTFGFSAVLPIYMDEVIDCHELGVYMLYDE
jgi:hypothetical protein